MGDKTCQQHPEVLASVQAESIPLHLTPTPPLNCLIFVIRIMWHSVIFSSLFWLFLYQLSVTQNPIFSDFILFLLRKQPPINTTHSIFLFTDSTIYKPAPYLAYSPCRLFSLPFLSFWVLEKWNCCASSAHLQAAWWWNVEKNSLQYTGAPSWGSYFQLHSSLHPWIHSYFYFIKPLNVFWRWFPKTKSLLNRCANSLLLPTIIAWDHELGHSAPRS